MPANDELVDGYAIAAALASGQLLTANGLEAPDYGSDYVWDRSQYEAAIKHTNMAGSGIATDQCMNWGQMVSYRDLTPHPEPVPTGFSGYHDMSWCPTRRVVLSWSAPIFLPLTLEWRQGAGAWTVIGALAAGSTSYVHGSNEPGMGSNQYRLSYNGKSTYATTSVFVACME